MAASAATRIATMACKTSTGGATIGWQAGPRRQACSCLRLPACCWRCHDVAVASQGAGGKPAASPGCSPSAASSMSMTFFWTAESREAPRRPAQAPSLQVVDKCTAQTMAVRWPVTIEQNPGNSSRGRTCVTRRGEAAAGRGSSLLTAGCPPDKPCRSRKCEVPDCCQAKESMLVMWARAQPFSYFPKTAILPAAPQGPPSAGLELLFLCT